MALGARVRDALPRQKVVGRRPLHGVVTIGAAERGLRVSRARPVRTVAAVVARQALRVLRLDRRAPLLGEADEGGLVGGVPRVIRAGPVTRFAASRLQLG